MEIIKRISSKLAWVKVDELYAQLLTFSTAKTNEEMKIIGQQIKVKRDRIKWLKQEIKRIKKLKE